jgi:hypothetical protein
MRTDAAGYGATEEEVGLEGLRRAAAAMPDPDPAPWWISYQAILALA